jgi:hypothetical protein
MHPEAEPDRFAAMQSHLRIWRRMETAKNDRQKAMSCGDARTVRRITDALVTQERQWRRAGKLAGFDITPL